MYCMSPSQTALFHLLTFNYVVILSAYLPDHLQIACSGPAFCRASPPLDIVLYGEPFGCSGWYASDHYFGIVGGLKDNIP